MSQSDKIPLKQETEEQKKFAATKIQSAFRRRVARLALKKLRAEKLEGQKSAAAIKIQSIWRGHSARVEAEKAKKHLLSYALLEKAKPYVDIPSNLQDVPRAFSKTPVYLPKELPIVLIQSGSPQNQEQFDQMKQGHGICEKNGYKNLVIPQARVYGDFIVKSRLPITIEGTKEQIGLYIENRERFTGAVKEFTGFLCQSDLNNITDKYSNDPYGALSKTPLGRYDNIALYVKEDQGKIGLINLKKFTPECSKEQKEWCFFKCRDAIHLFPYHLEEILSVAKKFDSHIEAYRQELELEREEALKRFKLTYEDHLDFIKEKGITFKNPLEIVELNPPKKENIKEALVLIIRKEHDDVHYKNCLGETPEEAIKYFEKSFPKILDLTTAFLSEVVKKKMEILKKKREGTKEVISSYTELLSCRTWRFNNSNTWYKELKEKVVSELQMIKIEEEWDKEDFASLIIRGIFEELAKERGIAYYNPNFGYSGHATLCIFC